MAASTGQTPLSGASLAKDLFEDMGRVVEGLKSNGDAADDADQKVVDVIESLCMNCHEDVCS